MSDLYADVAAVRGTQTPGVEGREVAGPEVAGDGFGAGPAAAQRRLEHLLLDHSTSEAYPVDGAPETWGWLCICGADGEGYARSRDAAYAARSHTAAQVLAAVVVELRSQSLAWAVAGHWLGGRAHGDDVFAVGRVLTAAANFLDSAVERGSRSAAPADADAPPASASGTAAVRECGGRAPETSPATTQVPASPQCPSPVAGDPPARALPPDPGSDAGGHPDPRSGSGTREEMHVGEIEQTGEVDETAAEASADEAAQTGTDGDEDPAEDDSTE